MGKERIIEIDLLMMDYSERGILAEKFVENLARINGRKRFPTREQCKKLPKFGHKKINKRL